MQDFQYKHLHLKNSFWHISDMEMTSVLFGIMASSLFLFDFTN